ncbi:hypothetical protein [Enterobacter hormaechei]|uniref:hypothetical protein n=1 Tax=Enterobacter hormaechei TaxID=158836 RepID=UPI0007982085|nr:hypothetical protein [Enterobacter hormaechei]CZZ53543.1 Uncharacterised protein [Enterobacter hormaechei]
MTNVSAVEKMAELMQQMEENSPRVAALQYCLSEVAKRITELEQNLAESQREFRAADATIENLEAKCAELAAENARLKKIVDFVTDLDNEPQYHDEGMGCGLEDRGITDRYEAMRHGWGEAMERVYGEVIPCAEEIETPATDAFLDEVRAQGVDALVERRLTAARLAKEAGHEITARDLEGEAIRARFFAMEIRKGVHS